MSSLRPDILGLEFPSFLEERRLLRGDLDLFENLFVENFILKSWKKLKEKGFRALSDCYFGTRKVSILALLVGLKNGLLCCESEFLD